MPLVITFCDQYSLIDKIILPCCLYICINDEIEMLSLTEIIVFTSAVLIYLSDKYKNMFFLTENLIPSSLVLRMILYSEFQTILNFKIPVE